MVVGPMPPHKISQYDGITKRSQNPQWHRKRTKKQYERYHQRRENSTYKVYSAYFRHMLRHPYQIDLDTLL